MAEQESGGVLVSECEPVPTYESIDADEGWEPQLVEKLCDLLYGADPGSYDLDDELAKLETNYGDAIYTELIYLLSHLRFEIDEAREHWAEIVEHRSSMEKRLGSPVDLRVALVSYFVEVNRRFKNPKIIELKLFEQTRASVYRDELTGLYNYRFFRESLKREIRRSERQSTPLSLIMFDIDDFKSYNDTNGHEVGNEALSAIGNVFLDSIRRIDLAARYGGEEFALILPETMKTGAHVVAERIRQSIEDFAFTNEKTQPVCGRLTGSLGVATFPTDAGGAGELFRAADRALYLAKGSGKNCVCLYEQDRRSYPRYDLEIGGRVRTMANRFSSLKTINVSESGVRFRCGQRLPVGEIVDVRLDAPGKTSEVSFLGRVANLIDNGNKRFEVAVRSGDTYREDRLALAILAREAAKAVNRTGAVPLDEPAAGKPASKKKKKKVSAKRPAGASRRKGRSGKS